MTDFDSNITSKENIYTPAAINSAKKVTQRDPLIEEPFETLGRMDRGGLNGSLIIDKLKNLVQIIKNVGNSLFHKTNEVALKTLPSPL